MGPALNHLEILQTLGSVDGFFAQHLRALLALV